MFKKANTEALTPGRPLPNATRVTTMPRDGG
jgi:hypothetical protein